MVLHRRSAVYRSIFILLLFCLKEKPILATSSYCTFDEEINTIYTVILDLDLEKAKLKLQQVKHKSSNFAYLLLENYIDFYQLFIHEEPEYYRKNKKKKIERLSLIRKSDLDIKWSNFLQAEILLQWSLIHMKMDDQLAAFQGVREALDLLLKNEKNFPEFPYTYKSLGIIHALLSTIPEEFQWAAKFIGLSGNLIQGKKELGQFLQFAEKNNDMFVQEAYTANSFLIAYVENKPQLGFQYWVRTMANRDPNPLNTFIQARLAMRAGYNDAALNTILSFPTIDRKKMPVLSLLLGLTKLYKLDFNAEHHFKEYLNAFKGHSYVKETYQKLSWCALLKNATAEFQDYKIMCLQKGNTLTDEDAQAMFDAKSNVIPDIVLLKARLLCDGGYAKKAYSLLIPKQKEYFQNDILKLECAYRIGRICQFTKQYDEAIENFRFAMDFDKSGGSHMSCNARIQSGVICEELRQLQRAKKFYEEALNQQPEQYRRSLHQKAKAGLSRINQRKD